MARPSLLIIDSLAKAHKHMNMGKADWPELTRLWDGGVDDG